MRPRAKEVVPIEDYKLLVTFTNDEKKVFDVTPYLNFVMFQPLKDKEKFKNVHIAGLSIEWEDGQDICPDELYYDSISIKN